MLADSAGLVSGITAAVTLVMMAALAPVVLREPPMAEGKAVLRYPRIARGLLLAASAVFAVMVCAGLYLAIAESEERLDAALWIGVPLLLGLAVAGVAEQRVRFIFDDEGIGGQTAFRGRRVIRWSELETARWSGAAQWLYLRDRHGEVIRISGWLPGFARLVGALERRAHGPQVARAIERWRKSMAVFGVTDQRKAR